jgi:hypothetical protein
MEIPASGGSSRRHEHYDRIMSSRELRVAGMVRCAVGLGFLIAPKALLGLTSLDDPMGTAVFLMRTKGIRDLAIGAGTVAASASESDEDRRRWVLTALGSDSVDGLAALFSRSSIGGAESLLYAATAVVLAGFDRWAFRSIGRTDVVAGEPAPESE